MPQWLTSVLHRNLVALDTQVRAVQPILRKELPYSTVFRLAVEYSDKSFDPVRPRSLFLKLCAPKSAQEPADKKPSHEQTGDATDYLEGIGRKEVIFYRDIAPSAGCPPLVRCYDAAYSAATDRSHILLDDLTETHSQPEHEQSPPEELSRLAVEALAKSHAYFWVSPATRAPRPLIAPPFDLRKFIENLDAEVREFIEVAGLTSAQKRTYIAMLGEAARIWGRLARSDHVTITHGDMHWWNFLYPKDSDVHSVHIFDWHLWHIDLGARDLAFLLALGGFAEPRPSIEEDLLRAYHRALSVPDYSWEMLIDDYRWSAIRNLNIPVIFWKQGKHEHTWRTALRRAYAAYERLECGELIKQL